MPEHAAVTINGYMNASSRAASSNACSSSHENGFRNTVSAARVGMLVNGLTLPAGSRYLQVARSSLSVSFQVFAATPRVNSDSRYSRATERVTCPKSSIFG